MAVELLKRGRTHIKGLYSKKKTANLMLTLYLGWKMEKPDSVWNFLKENKQQQKEK